MQEPSLDSNRTAKGVITVLIGITGVLLVLRAVFPLLLTVAGGVGVWQLWKRYQQHQQSKLTEVDEVFYRLIREHQGRITALDLAMNTSLSGTEAQQYLERRAAEFTAQFEITEQGGFVYSFESVGAFSRNGEGGSTVQEIVVQAEWIPDEFNSSVETEFNAEFSPQQNKKTSENKKQDSVATSNPSEKSPTGETQSSSTTVPEVQTTGEKEVVLFPLAAEPSPDIPESLTQGELAKRLSVHPNTVGKHKTQLDFATWSSQKDPDAIAWQYSTETKRFYPKVTTKNKTRIQDLMEKNQVKLPRSS